MQSLNHNANTYLAVTFFPHSHFSQSPAALVQAQPSLSHVGKVGELEDVQLYGVPKAVWQREGESILDYLQKAGGIHSVDVQILQTRSKRGGDEL